jgi:hypothetical protein
MIDQPHFSEIIKSFLKGNHPEFAGNVNDQDDSSFDCDLRNPTNEFSIWIATYNSEITIGLQDPAGKTEIHTHIACNNEEDMEAALVELSNTINNIKEDKLMLYHSDLGGYQWTDDINQVIMRKQPYESIKVFSWNGN